MVAGIEELREVLGISKLYREIAELRASVERLQPYSRPAWYNLRAACGLKGISYNSCKSRPELQPNGGKCEATIGGRRVWRRETVEAWLVQVDPPAEKTAAGLGRRIGKAGQGAQ